MYKRDDLAGRKQFLNWILLGVTGLGRASVSLKLVSLSSNNACDPPPAVISGLLSI